jgi:membrane associated rhomboid family serine protease/Zn-finger nucleic acid-binding protein
MPDCPRCGIPLGRVASPAGLVYGCARCQGRDLAVPVLRQSGATDEFLKMVVAEGHSPDAAHRLDCPHCQRPMAAITVQAQGHELNLDYCPACNAVWFDGGEIKSVPMSHRQAAPLAPKAREAGAILDLKLQRLREADAPTRSNDAPPEWWKWLPGLIGLPVEYEDPETHTRPWFTWAIGAAMVLCFLATMNDLPAMTQQWGFIPAEGFRHGGLTPFTSFFLHAGWLHLLSNLYFLLVFGNNVEDRLGGPFYLFLLAAATVGGDLVHALFDPHFSTPCIGASGGIAGVLGYYALVFPRAKVGLLFWFVFWIRLPAIALFALFLLFQLMGASMQVSGFGGVSYLAHLGGLTIGAAMALADRAIRRQEAGVRSASD